MGAGTTRDDAFFARLRGDLLIRARVLVSGSSPRSGRPTPDDLVQETILKLFTTYGEAALRERANDQLLSLGWRTMRNLAIDSGRKKTELLEPPRDAGDPEPRVPADPAPTADLALALGHQTSRVQQALGRLDANERRFIEHVLETDSVPAAQRVCGWPPKSPYYALRKILDTLRGELHDL